jgi:hypothetical protein
VALVDDLNHSGVVFLDPDGAIMLSIYVHEGFLSIAL